MSKDASPKELEDHYRLLGVEAGCSAKEISTAYRFKALQLHPDKNRGDPAGAQERFQALSRAYQVLSDPQARSAFEAVQRLRREREARLASLDSKRRRLQDDLLEREREARRQQAEEARADEELKARLEALRHEAARLAAKGEQDPLMQQMNDEADRTIKVATSNRGTDLGPALQKLLEPFQPNPAIGILKPADGGPLTALVVLEDVDTALTVMEQASIHKFPSHLKFSWAKGSPPPKSAPKPAAPPTPAAGGGALGRFTAPTDFEATTLLKLKQAAMERKRAPQPK